MRGIVKRFGDVVANAGIDFDLRPGEIHALLGENGAGKTTLMNILYGLVRPDAGEIFVRGRPVQVRSPQDAIAMGIGMVHQHFMLVPTLTVAENVVLGERGSLRLRPRDLAEVSRALRELGARYGLEVPPEAQVWQLSVGEQQRVEILRALYRRADILILDEPTASLAPAEVDHLLDRLRAMAAAGSSVVIITHHLDEVMACADRITVLRRGVAVATLLPGETTTAELARLMVGRDVSLAPLLTGRAEGPSDGAGPSGRDEPGDRVLEVRALRATGDRGTPALEDVTFAAGPGEIVAIAGVEGNGQAELEEILFGLRAPSSGTVRVVGEDVTGARASRLLQVGAGLIPSDRYRRGLARELSVAHNLVLDRIDRPPLGSRFTLRPRAILSLAAELIRRFSIQVESPTQPAGTLSGGNAQRVILARALSVELRLLIAAQPTRGLDVGAIEFVWDRLREQRDRGVAIVLISTDLDEVLALADRCHVLYRGRLVGAWSRAELDREAIGLAMGGARDGVGAAGGSPLPDGSSASRTGAVTPWP